MNIIEIFEIGKYRFEYRTRTLTNGDAQVCKLSPKESDLLYMLCENMNEVVERKIILSKLWGKVDYFCSRSMDVFVTQLRKRFKDDPQIKIANVWNKGFILKTE